MKRVKRALGREKGKKKEEVVEMWPKSSSAALLLCGSLLFSTPVFAAGDSYSAGSYSAGSSSADSSAES